jgi:hypothetical protein
MLLMLRRPAAPHAHPLTAYRKTLPSPLPPHRSQPAIHSLATGRAHASDLLQTSYRATPPTHAGLPLKCWTTGFNDGAAIGSDWGGVPIGKLISVMERGVDVGQM